MLTFRLTPEEYDRLGFKHLLFGLATAWLVGYGRWWDRPDDVSPFLRSGALSVLTVIGLGFLLHRVMTGLVPRHEGHMRTAAYVSLTSLPAAIYALPLERWMELEQARTGNVAMLAVVAAWRVALYVYLLRRIAGFPIYTTIVTTLLPLAVIICFVTISGTQFRVLSIMTGVTVDPPPPSTAETRFDIIASLSCLSLVLTPVLVILWLILFERRSDARYDRRNADQ